MPYAPGIQSTGGQSIQQGLTEGKRTIVSLLMNYAQKAEQSKALDGVLKAYTPEGDQRDALTKALPGMSLAEKQGIVQGHAVKQALAEYGQRSKLVDAQIGNLTADNQRADLQVRDALRQRGAQAALPGAWQEEANMPTNFVEQNAPRRGYGMESYVAAAGRVGAPIDPHVFATYMQDRNGQPGPADFVEDDVTGSRFLKYGKQVLPSGVNPAKLPKGAEELTDQEGNPIGHVMRGPKGNPIFIRPQPRTTAEPLLDPKTGQPVPGFGVINGRPVDFRTGIQKLVGDTNSPAGPASPTAADWTQSPDAVQIRSDVRSGKLTREQGLARLKALGIQ